MNSKNRTFRYFMNTCRPPRIKWKTKRSQVTTLTKTCTNSSNKINKRRVFSLISRAKRRSPKRNHSRTHLRQSEKASCYQKSIVGWVNIWATLSNHLQCWNQDPWVSWKRSLMITISEDNPTWLPSRQRNTQFKQYSKVLFQQEAPTTARWYQPYQGYSKSSSSTCPKSKAR